MFRQNEIIVVIAGSDCLEQRIRYNRSVSINRIFKVDWHACIHRKIFVQIASLPSHLDEPKLTSFQTKQKFSFFLIERSQIIQLKQSFVLQLNLNYKAKQKNNNNKKKTSNHFPMYNFTYTLCTIALIQKPLNV